ncbi:hypothetical protein BJY01DRAFT_259489 [Aspergillus pseudoustus]|uniref:Zn(2)-C6 fungal-type domain-containing protein n=1 Tax=Aspergillus pseudoustus TaxID=1810923 RepID=A0ABR4J3T1_9EURO
MSPKRACDTCISRKVRCSGFSPCDTCRDASKLVICTYSRPARKRGPKARRFARQGQVVDISSPDRPQSHGRLYSLPTKSKVAPDCISKSVLAVIVRRYQQSSYGVWPVINADALLQEIKSGEPEDFDPQAAIFYCLVTSLCAATMAQLHLAPISDGNSLVDSMVLAQTCQRIRDNSNCDRGNPGINSILTSFFLHVYHAKLNQRTSAMICIQDAIAGARILRLDKPSLQSLSLSENKLIVNKDLIFPLLWVTERGYALHLNISPSYTSVPSVMELASGPTVDPQARGVLHLVRLFVAFDHISLHRRSHTSVASASYLVDTENELASDRLSMGGQISARTADCHITREWMRTILWQEALALGFLSSTSYMALTSFGFPGQIGRDLLVSLQYFTAADLLPLGRDQLFKCFEIASTLADTILLTPTTSHLGCEFGPQDFLHALYQKLLPSLEQDLLLKSNLHSKMAKVLVVAPNRLLMMETTNMREKESKNHRVAAGQKFTI